jgi:hypothetical protein
LRPSRAKPGCTPRDEPLLIGHTPQQRGQLRALVGVERRAQGRLVLLRDPPDRREHLAPRRGQVQRVGPPVIGVVAPLDQAAPLELVDQIDEPTRHDAEHLRQRLLTQPRRRTDRPQHARVRRREPERRHPGRKLPRRVRPELGQQERERIRAEGRGRPGTGLCAGLACHRGIYTAEESFVL